jgi:hypothetical protein
MVDVLFFGAGLVLLLGISANMGRFLEFFANLAGEQGAVLRTADMRRWFLVISYGMAAVCLLGFVASLVEIL